jgi:glycosyltransferase involved in cell wall biosynthesis
MVKKKITIICPILNEENNIIDFYNLFTKIFDKLSIYNFSIIFADNKSSDKSLKLIEELCEKDKRISLLAYSKNFGVMKSIYTAISFVETDACAIFDCDMQDPPELILEFINKWAEGNKIVYGKRKFRIESKILYFFRKIQKKLEKFIKGYETNIESGAWFLDKNVIDEIKKYPYDSFLPGLISRLGFKSDYVEYIRGERKKGLTKFNYKLYILYGIDGLISGTITPLRISIFFSIIFAILCFISSIYFVLAKYYLKIIFQEGIAAILIINLLSFSIIFFILGIFGEYLGRIYIQKEDQRLAIVEKKINL